MNDITELEKALSAEYDIKGEPVPRSYLFPDGRFLALDSFRSHAGVEGKLKELGLSAEAPGEGSEGGAPTIEDLGAIRINLLDEGFIMLSKVRPTEAQYDSLRAILDERMGVSWKWRSGLLLLTPHQRSDFRDFDVRGKTADYVIGIIKSYYETGRLEEPMGESKAEA